MAFDLRLDSTSDLVFTSSKDLELIVDNDEIVQKLTIRLRTNLGEWFLNEAYGLDYDALFERVKTDDEVRQIVSRAILQDPNIVRIVELTQELNDRVLNISFKAVMTDNTVIEEETEVVL